MALIYGIRAEQQGAGANLPHIFSFATARSVANDTLVDFWNGATVATIKAAIDKDGKYYSNALTAGDVLYAVTGGVTNVRRLDSLAIGSAGQFLAVNSGATAPEWTSTLTSTPLILDQGTLDNAILKFQSAGDVATVLTTVTTPDVETDDYGVFAKVVNLQGGLKILSLAEDAASSPVTVIESWGGTATSVKSSSGRSLVEIYATEHDGANAQANIAANGNVFGVRGRVGAADVTLWLVAEGGDSWQSGGVTATTGTFSGAVSMTALTATTGTFSGAVSTGALTTVGNSTITGTLGGITTLTATTLSITNLTVPGTLTLTGATVSGTPTWSSNQAITLSTAAQPNVTSLGTLTALTVSGAITMTATASQIVPGVTSWAVRNNADSLNNLIITDAGAGTFRAGLTATTGTFSGDVLIGTTTPSTGVPRLDIVGGGAGGPSFVGSYTITDATDKSFHIGVRHRTNSEEPVMMISGLATVSDNFIRIGGVGLSAHGAELNATTIVEFYTAATTTTVGGTLAADITGVGSSSVFRARGSITADTGLTVTAGDIVMAEAVSQIVPGATSLSLRNNANNADNLIITDAGAVTFRSTVGGITTLTATTLGGTLSTATQNSVTTMTGLVTVGALNAGSIASGFGNINNGSSTLTTGVLVATSGTFSLDVSVAATKKIFLDGGGDTYISEDIANKFQVVVGGVQHIRVDTITSTSVTLKGQVIKLSTTLANCIVRVDAVGTSDESIIEFARGDSSKGRIRYVHNATASSEFMQFDVGGSGTNELRLAADGSLSGTTGATLTAAGVWTDNPSYRRWKSNIERLVGTRIQNLIRELEPVTFFNTNTGELDTHFVFEDYLRTMIKHRIFERPKTDGLASKHIATVALAGAKDNERRITELEQELKQLKLAV